VITAVVIEGRSPAEAARAYGVSEGWVSRLVARYRDEGEAAFIPHLRRPNTSPNSVTPHTFRKTVATLIDEEADTKSAAAQLGHGSEEVTETYYIDKPTLAPDNSDILEQLGAGGIPQNHPRNRRPKRAA